MRTTEYHLYGFQSPVQLSMNWSKLEEIAKWGQVIKTFLTILGKTSENARRTKILRKS